MHLKLTICIYSRYNDISISIPRNKNINTIFVTIYDTEIGVNGSKMFIRI